MAGAICVRYFPEAAEPCAGVLAYTARWGGLAAIAKAKEQNSCVRVRYSAYTNLSGALFYEDHNPAYCYRDVNGAIGEKWMSLGGRSGYLGYATTDELSTPNRPGGRFNHFKGGSIYWTPETGAHDLHGAIRDKWGSLGWENSFLIFPKSDEFSAGGGRGRGQHFQGGSIYSTSQYGARYITGRIRDKWEEYGWENGFFGFPKTDEFPAGAGRGRGQHFQGASVYWTPQTDAHLITGRIRDKYAEYGWENGFLRFPISDELAAGGGGRFNNFEGGSIYWTPDTDAHVITGEIRKEWIAQGAEWKFLRFPISDEFDAGSRRGRGQHFQGGSIYWTTQHGAHFVTGQIRDYWAARGWENGRYGFPTTGEFDIANGGRRSNFENGCYIDWFPSRGPQGNCG
jgi:uncharacterized protein with LGFP repeats